MPSKTDKRIIQELQRNGRMSYTELASKLDISLTTAASRTEKLISSKVIEVKGVANPEMIGLKANAMILIQAEPARISSICDDFIDHFNVPTILTVFGRCDILMLASFPNWDLLNDFINEDLSRVEGIVKIETILIREFIKRYEEIFHEGGKNKSPDKLNKTERKIVHELIKDGRMGLNEISEAVGVHMSNVSRSIRSLINREILKIIALPNAFFFGFHSAAFILIEAKASEVDQICDILAGMPELYVLAKLVNGSGIAIGIQSVSNEALYQFIKEKVSQIEGVLKIESFVTAELKKRLYGWLAKPSDLDRLAI